MVQESSFVDNEVTYGVKNLYDVCPGDSTRSMESTISSRSVASLRKELRIPAVWKRRKIVAEEAKRG